MATVNVCTSCGAQQPHPPPSKCTTCGAAPGDASTGPPEVRTTLSLAEAMSQVSRQLVAAGVQVTGQTSDAIHGSVAVQKKANPVVAIVLLLLCIIPGIVYLVLAGKQQTFPLVVTFLDDGHGGTLVRYSGQGLGYDHARYAAMQLPAS